MKDIYNTPIRRSRCFVLDNPQSVRSSSIVKTKAYSYAFYVFVSCPPQPICGFQQGFDTAKIRKKQGVVQICMDFNTNLTEKGILIVNTAHCTNRAENPVFIEILISVVLLQHCINTTLTLHMHCLQGIALQLQHYNKSMPILK